MKRQKVTNYDSATLKKYLDDTIFVEYSKFQF